MPLPPPPPPFVCAYPRRYEPSDDSSLLPFLGVRVHSPCGLSNAVGRMWARKRPPPPFPSPHGLHFSTLGARPQPLAHLLIFLSVFVVLPWHTPFFLSCFSLKWFSYPMTFILVPLLLSVYRTPLAHPSLSRPSIPGQTPHHCWWVAGPRHSRRGEARAVEPY